MKIAGYEILKSERYSEVLNQVNDIQKRLKDYQKLKPGLGENYRMGSSSDGVKIPIYHINEKQIYHLALQSDIVLTVTNALRKKIFKRGHEFKEKIENPSEEQLEKLKNLLQRANTNNQKLFTILKTFERDMNFVDDGYLIVTKEYIFNNEGEILMANPKELIRASPLNMKIIADYAGNLGYNDAGEKMFVDPTNRKVVIKESEAKRTNFRNKNGIKFQPAHYRGEFGHTGGGKEAQYIYYMKGEVFHDSKHNPTTLYGYSPLLPLWMKIVTLIEQDRFLLLNYQKGRSPRGILVINTTNYASMKSAWETLKAETRKDPHSISPLITESNERKGGGVQWVDFMKSLPEMQFIEQRNESRRAIGAIFGVMPLFSGDIEQAGGLNNESQQIAVTNDAVEDGQKIYNEEVFPWILEQFGITDWELTLAEPEEVDEIAEQKKIGLKMDNANKMKQMGFDVSFNKEEEEFEFSEETVNEPISPGLFGQSFKSMMDKRMIKSFRKKFQTIVKLDQEELSKEGIVFDIQKADPDFVVFISQQLFDRKFEGLSKSISDKIKGIILTGVEKKQSNTEVAKKIEKLGVDENQAEMIVRTESSVLKNSAREFNFRQAEGFEDFLYKWIGPNDRRTSDISKEIKKKSLKGLKLEKLKSLVRKTSEKFGFTPDRDWFSHPNQRHTFTRIV